MIDALSLLPEYDPARTDSRHRLVVATSQRAKHLMQGAKPMAAPRYAKATSVALDEMLHHNIEVVIGKEARQAIKEVKRGKDSEMERMAATALREDAREIKKELSVFVDDSVKPSVKDREE
ncbi:MAG: DNA-directed RNA polymerase subunit omega [Nitrospira sp.]|nr:DNA-directed RNA polymerase subunit omega [Betaproteobacteria bacterium]MBM4120479.1 DNA-directed RNA polymerase subunit omega [Nitrospira sp.]